MYLKCCQSTESSLLLVHDTLHCKKIDSAHHVIFDSNIFFFALSLKVFVRKIVVFITVTAGWHGGTGGLGVLLTGAASVEAFVSVVWAIVVAGAGAEGERYPLEVLLEGGSLLSLLLSFSIFISYLFISIFIYTLSIYLLFSRSIYLSLVCLCVCVCVCVCVFWLVSWLACFSWLVG